MKPQLQNKSEANKKLSEEVMKSNGRNGEKGRESTSKTSGAISGQHAANFKKRSTTDNQKQKHDSTTIQQNKKWVTFT
jgi:hypothetical protein